MYSDDTIAAISTAPGEGGIGIIRISGKDSLDILNRVFDSKSGKSTINFSSYTIRYGHIIDHDNDSVIDEVLVSYMKSPNTYTREDVVEINCHGGAIPVKKVLELVLREGARLAEPGEFTKRAFLNGRIDLAQAEAVIDMIRSKTEMSMEAALKQLEGKLSKKLGIIKNMLVDIMSHIEASIDFPEEDVEDVLYESLLADCSKIIGFLDELIKSSDAGKILRDGLNTIIIGKPNVGKSSLLNALIEENRAIVTDIPGTTRDIIEEHLNIKGIPVNIVDTAGIRNTEDMIERIGVEKTKEYIERADLVIFMLDSSETISAEDTEIFSLIKKRKCIIIVNKVDLPRKLEMKDIEKYLPDKRAIEASVKENYGVELIKDEIVNLVYSGEIKNSSEVLVTNIRHKDLLAKSKISMINAVNTIKMGLPLDLISIDIRQALEYIGEITGETVQEDIIDRIFTQFCIGK